MRKILLFIMTLTFGFLYAGNENDRPFRIISKSKGKLVVKVKLQDYQLKPVRIDDRVEFLPGIPGGAKRLERGSPELPHLATSLIMESKQVKVDILNKKEKVINDIDILPSKGNIYRNQDPMDKDYVYGRVYSKDKYFPGKITQFGEKYYLREYEGIPLRVTPMQYNPVQRKLKLYTELTLRITYKGNGKKMPQKVNRAFQPVYKSQFLNYSKSKYKPVDEHGAMLVFIHSSFDQAIKPFVDWKNKIGIPTKQIRIDTLGNGSAQDIKNYINSYYQKHDLAYVLLVGDANYVPTNSISSGDSDHEYGYLKGNDSYPEVFVGRFSAETTQHVTTMVQRTISYETGLSNSGSWMNTSLGIASEQGPGDDNEMDYEHIRNIQTDLKGYHYSTGNEFFDGTHGGNDAPGDPTATQVKQKIDNNAGNIVYIGHGNSTSWVTSGFSNTQVNQLSNTSSWPFIWSVACLNGDFVSQTCFAESWIRAEKNSIPTGAIATLMSTINQSWDPPMHAQDEMVDILVESYANNIKRSFGGISMNGCMAMNDAYGSNGEEMTDTWTIFGDPSFMVRTDTSKTLSVNHSPAVFVGDSTLTVNTSANEARVALSLDGQILDVEYVNNGSAKLKFSPFVNPDTMKLAVVAYNHDVFLKDIAVKHASGPYIGFKKMIVNDSLGNHDNGADQGEDIILDIMLENIGMKKAQNVSATLSTSDTAVTILKD